MVGKLKCSITELGLRQACCVPGAPKTYNNFSDVVYNQNIQYSSAVLSVKDGLDSTVGEGFTVITADACNMVVSILPAWRPTSQRTCSASSWQEDGQVIVPSESQLLYDR